MNLTTERNQNVSIVRVNETRLMYPILSEFASTITSLIGGGDKKLLLDLSTVTYVDTFLGITTGPRHITATTLDGRKVTTAQAKAAAAASGYDLG